MKYLWASSCDILLSPSVQQTEPVELGENKVFILWITPLKYLPLQSLKSQNNILLLQAFALSCSMTANKYKIYSSKGNTDKFTATIKVSNLP